MKPLKSLAVLFVLVSGLSGCQKDIINKEEEEDGKVIYTALNLPMNGSQEVPQSETLANGLIDAEYDKRDRYLDFTIRWSQLTGIPTGAHIHGPASPGVNAGIKNDFFDIFPKTTAGFFKHSILIDGISIKEDSLLKGFYYVNIHTASYPGGEIRAQIEFE